MIHPVIDPVEGEFIVGFAHVFREGAGLTQHVLVERLHRAERNGIFGRVEIVQIPQNVAERVADLLVVLSRALHERFGADDVFAEVDRRNPQAHDLRAHAIGDVDRIDVIAARFRHSAALLIEYGRYDGQGIVAAMSAMFTMRP